MTIVLIAALVVVWRSVEVRLLVLGLGMLALGWMALRALHSASMSPAATGCR